MPLLAPGEVGYAGYPAGTVINQWPVDLGALRLGRVDDYGGQWYITAFTGSGSPPTAVEATQRTSDHGAWIGGRWWAAKPYSIDIDYEGASATDRWAAEQRLLSAIGLDDTAMVMHEETPRRATVILNGELTIDQTSPHAFTAQVPLLADDPFRYALEPFTADANLPLQSGGLSWPTSWSTNWDAVVTSGAMSVANDGNETSYPVIRVYGPLPDFTLARPDTGEYLTVDLTADGEELAEGEWLEVNMRTQTVRLLGQSSRRRALRGDFFGLPQGETTVMFASSEYNATARAQLTGYSTWR